jgi:hypothetical protein
MRVIKKISYLGQDKEFFEEMEIQMQKVFEDELSFNHVQIKNNIILNMVGCEDLNIVLIDLTNQGEVAIDGLIAQTEYIKSKEIFKDLLFVAILENEKQKIYLDRLFDSGFYYTFIKGSDEKLFIVDLCYIAFDGFLALPRLAQARKLKIPYSLKGGASFNWLNSSICCLETDVDIRDEEIKIDITLFGEIQAYSFKFLDAYTEKRRFPFGHSTELSWPYDDPWEDPREDHLQRETVDTWIDSNKNECRIANRVKLITKQKYLIASLFNTYESEIDIHSNFDIDNLSSELGNHFPEVIIVEAEVVTDNEVDLSFIEELIQVIKSFPEYFPILFVARTPSTAQAMSKVYDYDKIVCWPDALDLNIIRSLVSKVVDKKSSDIVESDSFYFESNDKKRFAKIHLPVTITSMTEHEITFVSDVELLYYSSFYLDLPVPCFLTVVPCQYELDKPADGYHYTALINGTTEEDQERLRAFVNQIIYKSIDSLTPEIVEDVYSRKDFYKKNVNLEAQAEPVYELKKKQETKKVDEQIVYQRKIKNGRSKL